MSEEINKRIGDYQILNELGSGGMGRVYRVRNVISDRIEAMKVLLPDLVGQQELATRFLREIKLMASLNHPNIAQLRTAFTANNQLVMIMEYVEGSTLADRMEHGPIPVPEALNYLGAVLDALGYAHRQHVIHRDIKPANIMVTPEGAVKLMDFGIARAGDGHSLTMTGTTLGSLGYMSPEQVQGEATDARSDLYSVGVSLYEMVTGQRPFRADSDFSLMTAHVRELPKPPVELQPGLPPALNEIILMSIAKDPAQRFQSAEAFANALSSVSAAASAANAAALKASEASTAEYAIPPGIPANPPKQPVTSARPMADAKPTAVSVPAPIVTPPAPLPGSHRGLYMALGALIVLAVLVVGGIYLPRHSKTEARQGETEKGEAQPTLPAATAPPAVVPNATVPYAAVPDAAVPDAAVPNAGPGTMQPTTAPVAAVSKPRTPHATQPAPLAPANGISNAAQNAPIAGQAIVREPNQVNPEPMPGVQPAAAINRDDVERQVDQLSNRAAAVNGSLDRLQQQQSAAGYGLRGDMAARQASMNTNLSKAESAMERGDLATAKKRADLGEVDAETLEHFLGH
ncbi:MAG: protein kinase [Terriglobales bacterium]